MYSPRKLDQQNLIKDKLTREINLRCEDKIRHKVKVNCKLARQTRNIIKHNTHKTQYVKGFDYYTTTWDKLIHKTRNDNNILNKSEQKRSVERDRENSQTKRTVEPDFVTSPKPSNYGVYYHQPPQTAKHVTNKIIMFKPPLAPKDGISGCER
jgi:hypothetical protein